MVEFLAVPLLACLLLTAIHVYLGLHVLARGVIFVDLALAQVAALGVTVAFLAGHPIQSEAAYWYALAFTLGGAALFAASRTQQAPVPQEAIIGIVYAVSAAAAVLVVDQAPQGSEHIKQILVGSILTVTPAEVGRLALLYAPIGLIHWLARRPLLDISFDPDGAGARRAVRWWDFVFYASFGVGALRNAAAALCAAMGLAGLTLVLAPQMDHWWLDGLEAWVPGARTLFLRGDELDMHRDSVDGVQRSTAELERVRALQREAQWGSRQVSEDMQERMRQYLAGRAEMLAGDRMVLRTLRDRARAPALVARRTAPGPGRRRGARPDASPAGYGAV